MKRNLGNIDKTIRIMVAIAVAALYISHVISGTVALILGIIAIIFIITSFINFCPLYSIFGFSTFRKDRL